MVLALVDVLVQLVEQIKPAAPKQQLLGLLQHVEVDHQDGRLHVCFLLALDVLPDGLDHGTVVHVTQTDGGDVQSLGDNTQHHGHVFPHVLGLDGLDRLECLVHVANTQIDGEVDDN